MMENEVGRQRHPFFVDFRRNLLKLEHLPAGIVGTKLRKVQVPLRILNMAVEPEADRLNFCIPRVACAVAVAVIAGNPEGFMDLGGNCKMAGKYRRRSRTGGILRWPDKLYEHSENIQTKENAFEDLHQTTIEE